MEFLSQTYVALRGPTGAPQTAADTIGRLSDRLSPTTLLADRRAAVLALKGLARDCKQDVGDRALPGLLDVLYNDAEVDMDIGKAVLDTLHVLCDTEDSKDLGFKFTDSVLATERAVHSLFSLLEDNSFYIRLGILQLLSTLLQNRRQVVQGYFLTAPVNARSVISALEDKREIIRNAAITMLQTLISQSPDIQKILAFEGAFEKLFNIVQQEGGIEGGIGSQEALASVDSLLRYNSSNQSYFRETGLPPSLCALLLFPSNIPLEEPAPQNFALQFWDNQKLSNASYVVSIIGMLVGSKGGSPQETIAFSRCLIELALASNAPTALKTQALRLLPTNLVFPLPNLILTPYLPVLETNGDEWDRLEPASALDAIVELALHGEYNGLDSDKRLKEGLELRAAAVSVFEKVVRTDEVKEAILRAMTPQGTTNMPQTPLLQCLTLPLNSSSPLDPSIVMSIHIATFLFAHLLRSSSSAKSIARAITPPRSSSEASSGHFFVPADGGPPPPTVEEESDDDDGPQTLLQILNENLSLAFLSRARADTSDRESREWDRLIVGYLSLLSQWLWEDSGATRDYLNAGGLGTLVESINQVVEGDSIVPGLCAFLLGICYEFNREPGEITRATIYPIVSRLGEDTLSGRLARLRDDERLKAVGPDSVVLPYPASSTHVQTAGKAESTQGEGEIWFDWAFVDFWKSNFFTVQRAFSSGPEQLSSRSNQNAESAMLISSLRDVIRQQTEEIETLRKQLNQASANSTSADEMTALKKQVASWAAQFQESEEKRREVEKEQEDLLVLLDEVSSKRKRDKAKMRDAGLDVSEDEADDDDDDDEE